MVLCGVLCGAMTSQTLRNITTIQSVQQQLPYRLQHPLQMTEYNRFTSQQ